MSVKSTNDNQETSDMVFLSVIIPTYNESENIFKLLDMHNYKMKDHLEYMRNMYTEALEKIR